MIIIACIVMTLLYPVMNKHFDRIDSRMKYYKKEMIQEMEAYKREMIKREDFNTVLYKLNNINSTISLKLSKEIKDMVDSLTYTQHLQDCIAQGQHWYGQEFSQCIGTIIDQNPDSKNQKKNKINY